MAQQLLGSLRPGMLLLADRNFYSWRLWHAAAATGACLLWRVTAAVRLRPLAELPDGSWLAHVDDPRAVTARHRRNGMRRRRGSGLPPDAGPLPGMTVRVIEYHLTVTADDGTARTERYRHLTTLLDWASFPARDLAAAYARRRAIETGYRECKACLRGSGRPLRGGTPALARQELWALLAVYQAVRTLHRPRRRPRWHRPGPGLVHRRPQRRPPHHRRPPPPARRSPRPRRDRDARRDRALPPRPRLPPRRHADPRPLPLPQHRQDPRITARHRHRHHHHAPPSTQTSTHQHKQPQPSPRPATLNSWHRATAGPTPHSRERDRGETGSAWGFLTASEPAAVWKPADVGGVR